MRACRGSPIGSPRDAGVESSDVTMLPGRPRVQAVSSHHRTTLGDGWELCATDPGAATDPAALRALETIWRNATVPGTVAESFRVAGELDLDRAANFDDRDWWYRCTFAAVPSAEAGTRVLRLDGLATLAEVWLNDTLVLASDDMFVAHEVDVCRELRDANTLLIRFRSLTAALAARRPRPRWRTKLVEHQQLRWVRTTLLGRMPGWSPPVRPVGPWRAIVLEARAALAVDAGDVCANVVGDEAKVHARFTIRPLGAAIVRAATLVVGEQSCSLDVVAAGETVALVGTMRVADPELWWPRTHGEQPLHEARVIVATDRGDITVDLGHVAFRRIEVSTDGGNFSVSVNGVRIFCRGACWTTPDIVTLGATSERYRALLEQACDAGMNMIRVGGTMVYEADAFYDWCDRLGILVWQDFMFASMDYPSDDPAFMATVGREAEATLARLRRHASLAIVCGNSEVEQQAAMLGVAPDRWGHALFHELLAESCARGAPNVHYWPSSPSGGALPFHPDAGVAHYYGVGAYLRPLDDARRSGVRFATECLAFANVPDPAAIDALLAGGESPVHHPRWKARVPRDHGAGWDFDDVRDHYLEALFGVNPVRLRSADMERYLSLSRVVTGEVMARTIGEWRRAGSTCGGALVWVFQDLWLGAGWGLIDATGHPKAAYYAARRAMQPVALALTDEGTNGLHVHVANDLAHDLNTELRVTLFRGGHTRVASASGPCFAPARAATVASADAILGQFHDVAYAYRFGPPGHDLVVATLHDAAGTRMAEAYHFPLGLPSARRESIGLSADAVRRADGSVAVTLRTEQLAQSVAIDAGLAVPDDNYFHIPPGGERTIVLSPPPSGDVVSGFVQPLNAYEGARFAVSAEREAFR